MDTQKALQDIKAFLLEAGELAVKAQKAVKVQYKDGNQALTETDLAISKLAQERLGHWFALPNHILLDEESISTVTKPEETFQNNDYLWALDPIDGTAGYALGRKLYAISLGILHKGQPLIGGFYLPALNELVLADEVRAWRIENCGTEPETEHTLLAHPMEVNSQIFVESYFGKGCDWGNTFDKQPLWMNRPESALQGFFSALSGQAAGATMIQMFSIWDVAAASAVAARAGFTIRSMTTERTLESFQASDFKDSWKLADDWLMCHERNFKYISKALKGA